MENMKTLLLACLIANLHVWLIICVLLRVFACIYTYVLKKTYFGGKNVLDTLWYHIVTSYYIIFVIKSKLSLLMTFHRHQSPYRGGCHLPSLAFFVVELRSWAQNAPTAISYHGLRQLIIIITLFIFNRGTQSPNKPNKPYRGGCHLPTLTSFTWCTQ